ncbi:MAG: hypothetical protein ACTSRK_00595 [Promethearchaeota archaeon]
MDINSFKPMDPEIDQIHYDKQLEDSINKLQDLEDAVRRSLKDLASKIRKTHDELGNYHKIQFENERNYIQLVNRNSDLVKKPDLNRLKEHNKRTNIRLEVQKNMSNVLLQLSNDYKELTGTLKDLGSVMGKMNKKQSQWRDYTADLAKLKGSQMASGGKLNKVEGNIRKSKESVIKLRDEVKHREGFVETALKRIYNSLIKLKNTVKNFAD